MMAHSWQTEYKNLPTTGSGRLHLGGVINDTD